MQCEEQAILELLLSVILQQVQLVEAGVSARQASRRPICFVNLELLGSRYTLQT